MTATEVVVRTTPIDLQAFRWSHEVLAHPGQVPLTSPRFPTLMPDIRQVSLVESGVDVRVSREPIRPGRKLTRLEEAMQGTDFIDGTIDPSSAMLDVADRFLDTHWPQHARTWSGEMRKRQYLYPSDWFVRAFKRAKLSTKFELRSFGFFDSILQRWDREGVDVGPESRFDDEMNPLKEDRKVSSLERRRVEQLSKLEQMDA